MRSYRADRLKGPWLVTQAVSSLKSLIQLVCVNETDPPTLSSPRLLHEIRSQIFSVYVCLCVHMFTCACTYRHLN